MVHHSADSSTKSQFLKIDGVHKNRKFPKSLLGFYVGYHFVIDPDGKRWQSRQTSEVGAHSSQACDGGACNVAAVGICLAGDFTKTDPTEEQKVSLHLLWKDLGYPRVMIHKDVKNTACPGKFDFYGDLKARRMSDLQNTLKLAERALPKLMGTSRGKVLQRQIHRIKQLLTEV